MRYSFSRFVAIVSLLIGAAAVRAAGAAWEAGPDSPTGLEIVRDGILKLKVGLVAWGPGYKWFSLEGKAYMDHEGARVMRQNATINGTSAKMGLDLRMQQTSPTSLEMGYSVEAMESVDMTGVALTLRPGEGTQVTATFDDGSKAGVMWEKSGDLPRLVKQLTFEQGGETYSLDVDPARPVETYQGDIRIWLVRKHIDVASPEKTTCRLTLPAEMKFYVRESDMAVSDITPEWFAYPVSMSGTPVDLSFLNKDASGKFIPAGAHGFLGVKGDEFVFQDGTPARFWGVNVTAYAAMATTPRAQQIADRLARMGCNVVRLHHLDSWGPSIIDTKSADNTTQHLDEANMARLDRLIYELKIRGIYVILDPWVGRWFRPGDEVALSDQFPKNNFGLHPYIFFDARMRQLHKEFLRQFWTHVNPLTGTAYKDEPAVATTECANEALFAVPRDLAEPYRSEFLTLYKRWCVENGQTPIGSLDDVYRLNYPLQNQQFYQWLMREFYADIHQYLRQEIGLKIPINSSNWFHWPWEIGSQTGGDFMDSHHYYHGDRVGPTATMGGLWVQNPIVHSDTPFGTMSAMAIYGKPLTTSECGDNPPQTYRSAYYVGLAAVACLQGYDSITPFAYTQAPQPQGKLSNYEMESDPATVASMAAGALIYRRGDVSPAKKLAVMYLPADEQYAMHWQDGGAKAFDHTPQFRAMTEIHKVAVVYGDRLPEGSPAPAVTMTPASAFEYKHPDTQLLSDTQELWRDWSRGVGLINTPRTQAAYGFLAKTPISTADAAFSITTPYATCVLSSLTNDPINKSNHLLLTAVARAEDANQTYNLSRTKLNSSGKPPVLAEPVVGTVTFSTSLPALVAHPLMPNGVPGPAIPIMVQNGKATLELKASAKTLFYDITPAH